MDIFRKILKIRNIFFAALAILIIATAFLTFKSAVHQLFHLDEAEEAAIGLKMAKVGPKVFLPVPEGNMPLTHAPLYTFTHSLIQKIFGPAEFPLRMYGVFHFLLCLLFTLLITARLIGDSKIKVFTLLAAASLYLVNPLLVQHSVVINADNNISASAILIFMFFFISFEKLEGRDYLYSRITLAFLLALCFWSKELTPAFLFAGVIIYRLIGRDFRRLIIDFVLVGFLGFVIFWSTWWLYCVLTSTDVLGFVKFTIIDKGKNAFSGRYLHSLFYVFTYGMRWHILWVSLAFWIALAIFLFERVKNFYKQRSPQVIDLISICAFSMWLPYQFFRPNVDMVKYHYPSYIFFIVLISWLFNFVIEKRSSAREEKSAFTVKNIAIAVSSIFILVFYYYRLGDYLLTVWDSLGKRLDFRFISQYCAPIAAIVIFIALASKRNFKFVNITIWMIILILPVNIALGLNQAKADYFTVEIWRNYGEAGMDGTLAYLKKNIRDDSVISVRSDIAYYLIERYGFKVTNIRPEEIFSIEDDEAVVRLFSAFPVDFLVMDKVTTQMVLTPHAAAIVGRFFYRDKQIGDFYIFRRRPTR